MHTLVGVVVAVLLGASTEALAQGFAETTRLHGPLLTAALAEGTYLETSTRLAEPRLAQTVTPVAPSDLPKRRWAARHPVVLGTLIGIGAGAAVALTQTEGSGVTMPALALGAGVGVTGGLIASAIQRARLRYDAGSAQPSSAAVKRIVAILGAGERITVTEVSSRQTKGRIQVVGEDKVAIVPDGQGGPVEIAYADISAVKGAQAVGTKVGLAVAGIGGVGGTVLMCLALCGGN